MTKNSSFLSYYLLEIKWRLFYSLISFGITFCISWYFSKIFLFYITDPAILCKDFSIISQSLQKISSIEGMEEKGLRFTPIFNNEVDNLVTNFLLFTKEKLIYTDMTEGLINTLEICVFFSLLCWSMYFFYHIWAFLKSSILSSEQWKLNSVVSLCLICILNSWLISFHIILPFSWKFFTSFQLMNETMSINCEPRFQSYCFFLYWIFLVLVFSHLVFLCFILLIYSKKIKLIDFPSKRTIPLFCFLLLSALISPPDLFSQLVIFLLIWYLFEFLYFFTFYITCRIKKYYFMVPEKRNIVEKVDLKNKNYF